MSLRTSTLSVNSSCFFGVHEIKKIKITDKNVLAKSNIAYHPIAIKSESKSDTIEGVIFEITEEELLETDKYEVTAYKRVLETFESGKKAWVYVSKNEH